MVTLAEYEAKFDNKHKVHTNGSIYIELPQNQTDEERYLLWKLEDYLVYSASFLVIWLIPRTKQMTTRYALLHEELGKLVGDEAFDVIFIKKDKSKRTMNCLWTDAADQLHLGYLTVWDTQAKSFKAVNLNTLISLTFQNKTYTIKDNQWV